MKEVRRIGWVGRNAACHFMQTFGFTRNEARKNCKAFTKCRGYLTIVPVYTPALDGGAGKGE